MTQDRWTAVDRYITDALVPNDPILEAALRAQADAGLPPINVAPNQGKLLHLLARMAGARNILEVGTLAGYSTIWLARALPEDGRIVTLEFDPKHAEVARTNLERAGMLGRVDIRLGRAIDTLPRLESEGLGPFDFVFIDADKPSTPQYFEWAMKLTGPGSVIIVDNVIRNGTVVDPGGDANVEGVRRFQEMLSRDGRVTSTAIQTVGVKGYDGFAIALVTGD